MLIESQLISVFDSSCFSFIQSLTPPTSPLQKLYETPTTFQWWSHLNCKPEGFTFRPYLRSWRKIIGLPVLPGWGCTREPCHSPSPVWWPALFSSHHHLSTSSVFKSQLSASATCWLPLCAFPAAFKVVERNGLRQRKVPPHPIHPSTHSPTSCDFAL